MRNPAGGDGSPRVPRRSGVAGLYAVPKRAERAADPSKTWVLDAHTARVLSTTPVGALVAKICMLIEPLDDGRSQTGASEGDRIPCGDNSKSEPDLEDVISVDEAAAILHMPRERLIRNKARYPFVKQVSRKHFVCLRSATMHWLASRPNSFRGN